MSDADYLHLIGKVITQKIYNTQKISNMFSSIMAPPVFPPSFKPYLPLITQYQGGCVLSVLKRAYPGMSRERLWTLHLLHRGCQATPCILLLLLLRHWVRF